MAEKLKDDGVVGSAVDPLVVELEGAAGWEKVNCSVFKGAPLLPVVSALVWAEIEGAAAG